MTQADQVREWGGKHVQVREEEDEEMREREVVKAREEAWLGRCIQLPGKAK